MVVQKGYWEHSSVAQKAESMVATREGCSAASMASIWVARMASHWEMMMEHNWADLTASRKEQLKDVCLVFY